MSIVSEFSFWQELLLLGLALLSLLYVFYFKIWVALAAGSDFVFAAALAVAVASVATAFPFEQLATVLVEGSALPQALRNADEKVAAIESLPGTLIDRALTRLGYEPDPANEPSPETGPGPFESKLRPAVEALVSVVLRTASFLTATLLLLMALALRSSTSTAKALQNLSLRTAALEARLAEAHRPDPGGSNRGILS